MGTCSLTWRVCSVSTITTFVTYHDLRRLGEASQPISSSKRPSHVMLLITIGLDSSSVGIFKLSHSIQRELPTKTDELTYEFIHPSVESRPILNPTLENIIKQNPALVCMLAPLEKEIQSRWPDLTKRHGYEAVAARRNEFVEVPVGAKNTLLKRARTAITDTFRSRTMEEKGQVMSITVQRHSSIEAMVHELSPSF
jgi:hypothetical protein